MSAVEAQSDFMRDISNMLPKWFKRTRSIKCGRKIICTDQLYGWRGIDTGYYGSEELEDAPDFLDEVQVLPVQNEDKDKQLQVLRKEAMNRLQKERETHPNFNILTDRAPTPDFSITYIETSYNTDSESVKLITVPDKAESGATDNAANRKSSSSYFGEPMEVDGSSLFCHNSYRQSQDMHEVIDSVLNSEANMTYTIEKNGDNKALHLLADEVLNIEISKPMSGLKLDETVIAEKTEGDVTVQAEERRECIASALDSVRINEEGEMRLQPADQKIFSYPAPLQATFDLSRIDRVDLSAGGKSEIYPINPRTSESSGSDSLEQIGNGIAHLNASRPSDRTTISFKTPKQHMKKVVERPVVEKQSAIGTPLFKKSRISSTLSRGTSTPVEEFGRHICPRYVAHHAALASHATQTGSGTPLSLHNKFVPANASTPVRLRLSNSPSSSKINTEKVLTPSRIPISTSALTEISPYGTLSGLSKRNALVDYELTPQSHLSKKRVLCQSTPERGPLSCSQHISCISTPSKIPISTTALASIAQYGSPSPLSKQGALVDYELTPQSHILGKERTARQERPVTQIPLSRFASEHLKSGGTPRPNSRIEKKWQEIAESNSLLSVPRTPLAKTDISQMLVDNVMRSGPACRRQPLPSKLLSPIGKLRFEKSAENSDLSPKHVSPTMEVAKEVSITAQAETNHESIAEEMNETQIVVIRSFDGETMEKLADDTANLSIADQQNLVPEEQKIVFDTTTNDCRKERKTPVFDTRNCFGQRRVLSILNDSNVSVNTPGKEEKSVVKISPSFSGSACDTSSSPVHIIAAKDENKHSAVLCARKIVSFEAEGQGLRRSTRKRVAPIRHWLGEKPVYRRDQQGTYELVRVDEAIVKDPLFVKYNTVDMAEVLQRQKREQRQHARARKLRKFDRARRAYAEEDAKTS